MGDDGPAEERPRRKIAPGEFFIDRNRATSEQFGEMLGNAGIAGPCTEKCCDAADGDARLHRGGGRWRANAGWNDFRAVGAFVQGASPCGALDLAGNGWEQVSSGLTREQARGTRGGGQDLPAEELRTTARGRRVFRSGHHNIGFRCAR